MGEWRPIQTAPKDRSILLHTAYGLTYCGRWRSGTIGEPQEAVVAWRCDSSGRFATPTHWMPLPAPPPVEPPSTHHQHGPRGTARYHALALGRK
jgi:hypothetical protein